MNDPLALRKCRKCHEDKIILLEFMNSSSPHTCKKCASAKQLRRKHKNLGKTDRSYGWNNRRFSL